MKFLDVPSFDFNTRGKFNISGVPRYPWLYRKYGRTSFTRGIRRSLPKPIYQMMRPLAEKLIFLQKLIFSSCKQILSRS